MKKLLSILAAVGLTATASTAVVACGSSKKADNTDKALTPDNDGKVSKTFEVKSADSKTLTKADFEVKDFKKDGKAMDADLAKEAQAAIQLDVQQKKDKDGKAVANTFVLTINGNVKSFESDKAAVFEFTVASTKDNKNINSAFSETVKVNIPAASKGGDTPAATDNSAVKINKAVISKDGTVITLTTDKLVVDVKDGDITVDGAKAKSIEGKKDSTTVTITLDAAATKDAKITVKGYATKDGITVDMSAMNSDTPAPTDQDNSKLTLSDAKTNADGTEIDVTVSAKLIKAVESGDITLDGVSTGSKVSTVDAKVGATTIKVTLDKAIAKADKATIKISGFATTDALSVSTDAMAA